MPWDAPLIKVIPAKAGIQFVTNCKGRIQLDSRLRGNDRGFETAFVPNDTTTMRLRKAVGRKEPAAGWRGSLTDPAAWAKRPRHDGFQPQGISHFERLELR